MNKKLLFATMSLAALAACTNDDFQSQNEVAQEASPIKFEVVNNDVTRASMGGIQDTKIIWNANDNDLFTLYHGGTCAASGDPLTAYQNATYKAVAGEAGSAAYLTTPSVIKSGYAIMTWPVDTMFTNDGSGDLAINIPVKQTNIVNKIPYVSDLINIKTYAAYSKTAPAAMPTAYNTAGYDRIYPVYMRPMASQLILNADYAGSDATLEQLYEGGSAEPAEGGISPIAVTSVDLSTQSTGSDEFTVKIPLTFTSAATADLTRWNTTAATKVPNNNWSHVTHFGAPSVKAPKLTTEVVSDNKEARFLILPQNTIASGVDDGAVVVNTNYGKVVVANAANTTTPGKYKTAELGDAWYRYISAATKTAGPGAVNGYDATETPAAKAESDGTFKTTTTPANGMMQTINNFSTYTHKGTSTVTGEPEGTASVRFVKVLLKYLDMSDLHIKTDKQLRDAAYVWKHMNLSSVTVYLDGNSSNKFEMSQTTIAAINAINKATNTGGSPRCFTVKPCQTTGEVCKTIVITEGGDIQDLKFIDMNGGKQASVELNAGETWKWNGTTATAKKVYFGPGVSKVINSGTMVNDATAKLATYAATITTGIIADAAQNNITLENNGEWDIKAGILNVQFNVTNNGKVKISSGAQYRQDGTGHNFTNDATTLEKRFIGTATEMVGKVENKGVFATVDGGEIYNYGLIDHQDKDAKTYVTTNAKFTSPATDGDFTKNFTATNKMGRINLLFSNKDEDNISISASSPISQGFVSVTVTAADLASAGITSTVLSNTQVGKFVNYMIVNSGIETITDMPAQVKYLEIADADKKEIAWSVTAPTSYNGLIVLSPVNIKLGTTLSATVTYLGADMYVGGTFNKAGTDWDGYYGDTSDNVPTKYITF